MEKNRAGGLMAVGHGHAEKARGPACYAGPPKRQLSFVEVAR